MKKIKLKKTTKTKIEFYLFKVTYKILKSMPKSFIKSFFIFISCVCRKLLKIRVELAKSQMRKVFPEMSQVEINKNIKLLYKHFALMIYEMYFADRNKIIKDAKVYGLEYMRQAYQKGRGVLIPSGHIGNWELAGTFLAKEGFPVSGVIKKQRNEHFDQFTIDNRLEFGVESIYMKGSLRYILKNLKKKYLITLMIDQTAGSKGILTDFLGFPASTHAGAAKIALKNNTPLVPAFARRDEKGINHFHVFPPIYPDTLPEEQRTIEYLTQHLTNLLCDFIRKYPSTWFWVHKRWKHAEKVKILKGN